MPHEAQKVQDRIWSSWIIRHYALICCAVKEQVCTIYSLPKRLKGSRR